MFILNKNLSKTEIFIIVAASVLPWLPILLTSFINDDYQIIGFHSSVTISSLLKPFYSPDISGFYWRPLGNFLHVLTLLITGFSAFAFRFGNLALYSLCTVQLARTSVKLGLNKNAAFAAAVIFALLPSHSYMIGWIASKGEFLLTILILLSVQYYYESFKDYNKSYRYLTASFVLFAAALLVKELAFALVFVPAAVMVLRWDFTKKNFLRAAMHTAAAALTVSAVLVIRHFIVGGNPFTSPHFHDRNVFLLIKNYFVYAVIGFFNPEFFEIFYSLYFAVPLILVIKLVVLFAVFLIYKNRKEFQQEKRILIFGLVWFTIFILPVLPVLMRWYPFTASIGLVWIVSIVFKKVTKGERLFYIVLAIVAVCLAGYNFNGSMDWYRAGKKMDGIILQIPNIERIPQGDPLRKNEMIPQGDPLRKIDSLLVFGSPDKLCRIPLMKLGVQQTFEYALKKKLEVAAPLRSELNSENTRIEFIKRIGNKLFFRITDGVFIAEGGRYELGQKNSESSAEIDKVKVKIITSFKNSLPESVAEVEVDGKYGNYLMVYFDGTRFLPLNDR